MIAASEYATDPYREYKLLGRIALRVSEGWVRQPDREGVYLAMAQGAVVPGSAESVAAVGMIGRVGRDPVGGALVALNPDPTDPEPPTPVSELDPTLMFLCLAPPDW